VPKNTTFPAGVALKFVPAILTRLPVGPEAGVSEVILGCARAKPVHMQNRTAITVRVAGRRQRSMEGVKVGSDKKVPGRGSVKLPRVTGATPD
jgi:hypothetical protein